MITYRWGPEPAGGAGPAYVVTGTPLSVDTLVPVTVTPFINMCLVWPCDSSAPTGPASTIAKVNFPAKFADELAGVR